MPDETRTADQGRRRRRVLEAELNGCASLVKGPGSRELVIEVSGRAPVWSSVRRGWSLQEHTARDVIAAAEARFYDIVITGPRLSGVVQ